MDDLYFLPGDLAKHDTGEYLDARFHVVLFASIGHMDVYVDTERGACAMSPDTWATCTVDDEARKALSTRLRSARTGYVELKGPGWERALARWANRRPQQRPVASGDVVADALAMIERAATVESQHEHLFLDELSRMEAAVARQQLALADARRALDLARDRVVLGEKVKS
jgi:hypothetical protein